MRRLPLFVLLAFFGSTGLACAEKPPEIESVIHASQPYGEGAYTWTWIKAYDAALWTDAKEWSMKKPFALTIQYHMRFSTHELADQSIEEMQHIQPLSKDEATAFNAQLVSVFRTVRDGDTITSLYIPGKGAQLFYNGKPTGSITDDAMAQRFLNIWLSDKTSAPDLRKKLLAGAHIP